MKETPEPKIEFRSFLSNISAGIVSGLTLFLLISLGTYSGPHVFLRNIFFILLVLIGLISLVYFFQYSKQSENNRFKSPKLTVDALIVEGSQVVLIRRINPPFQGMWALPGGFVDYGEKVEQACVREALEETCLEVEIKQLIGVYSDPGRDPRHHSVGVVYLCEKTGGKLKGSDDASEARWFPFDDLPKLAFDHGKILSDVCMLFRVKSCNP